MGKLRIVVLSWLAGLAACASLPEAGGHAPFSPDLASMSEAELTAFTRAMPKGGDLHIHLAGAPYAETLIGWAGEDGLCVDLVALSLTPPCAPSGDLVAARDLTPVQRAALIDSLSTRRPEFGGRTGHDQFFTAFDRFAATSPARTGDMLADIMRTLAAQNTWYVEIMLTPQGRAARGLGQSVGWRDDPVEMRDAIAPGIPALVEAARIDTDAMESRARALMGCETAEPEPGCAVTVRYLAQVNRVIPPEQAFSQIQLGVAVVAADPRWVGLQLVAPEDHPSAIANYRRHMTAFAFLTEHGGGTPVAMHAGELTLTWATPADLSFHVTAAVRAGARRIGHGVAIPYETGAADLVESLARQGVAVEINLTSNATILGVSGDAHPVRWLREAGVPVTLSTDDPGISRIDLSHEYARAVRETGATYADLVASARTALTHSFLSDPDRERELRRFEALLTAFEATEQARRRHQP